MPTRRPVSELDIRFTRGCELHRLFAVIAGRLILHERTAAAAVTVTIISSSLPNSGNTD